MRLSGATALVTGASGGLGHALAAELVERGAKVYATARRPELIDVPGVEVLRVDITDQATIDSAVAAAGDVDLLINNGAHTGVGSLLGESDDRVLRELIDTHLYGTLAMIRAFAPVLARNGGGGILNVLAVVAWQPTQANAALAVAKSAQWGLTNNIRLELADQGTLVSSLVPGIIDVPVLREALALAQVDVPDRLLSAPEDVATLALDGLERDEIEILDALSTQGKATLVGEPKPFDLGALAAGPER